MKFAVGSLRKATSRYLQTPLTPMTGLIDRLRFLGVAAGATLTAILLIHAFSATGLSWVETLVHALTIGAGFTAGLAIAVLAVWRATGERRTAGQVWLVMASGFLLGLGLVALLERFAPLAGVSQRAAHLHGPASMLPRLIPVWVVVTVFLARSEILRAYEHRFSTQSGTRPRKEGASETELDRWIDFDSTMCRVGDIARVSAEENYCRIFHVAGEDCRSFLIRSTLQELLGRLPSCVFLRVHRSHVVNCEFVQRVERRRRRFVVVLAGLAEPVPISRGRLRDTVAVLTHSDADGRFSDQNM